MATAPTATAINGTNGTSGQKPVLVPTASLHNRVALVTGSSRGIGAGIALDLASRGSSIILNYASSKDAATAVQTQIESFNIPGVRVVAIQADVSRPAEITRLFEEGLERMGHIDIVVSNSGTESWDNVKDITEEKFEHVFNLNARAQFFVGQAALKYCSGDAPRLVLMSSIAAGLLGVRDHALYNGSKMAVKGFVKSFATDFGREKKGFTVNGIAPGGVKSDMFAQNAWRYIPGGKPDLSKETIEKGMEENCPLGRCAEPKDVARVVGWLCSEDGGWVNGEIVQISGGSSQ